MGGNAIIQNNTFIANGYDGAEAVNCKAGVKADVVGNVMFSPNTNGLKLSSSGQSETRSQASAGQEGFVPSGKRKSPKMLSK